MRLVAPLRRGRRDPRGRGPRQRILTQDHETQGTPSTRCLLGRLSRTHTQQTDAHTDVSSITGATPLFSSPRRGRPQEVQAPAITATARGPSPRRDDLPIHSAPAEIAVDCRQCVPQRGHQRVSAPDRLRRRDATRPARVRTRRLRQGEGRVRRAAPATRSSARYFLNEQCARAGRAAGPSRKSGSRAVRGHSRRAFWPGLVEERSNNRFQERSTANPALACVWPTSA